jgi:hypothetical protein
VTVPASLVALHAGSAQPKAPNQDSHYFAGAVAPVLQQDRTDHLRSEGTFPAPPPLGQLLLPAGQDSIHRRPKLALD